jgi:uncharacterized protein (DUF305 family)
MTSSPRFHALLPLLCLVVAACAGAARTPRESAARPAGRTDAEIEALYQARLDSARTRFTPADTKFMTGMIAHHAQALTMAAMAPTHGASPAIRTLAARIENAQNDEIRLMQNWLRDRGQPVPELHRMDGRVMVHGADHDMSMPGMLTPERLAELDRARGAEFDRLFLTGMIQHHRGAVVMVQELFATDGAGQDEAAFKLASDVQVDQKTEIARMHQLLARLPAR